MSPRIVERSADLFRSHQAVNDRQSNHYEMEEIEMTNEQLTAYFKDNIRRSRKIEINGGDIIITNKEEDTLKTIPIKRIAKVEFKAPSLKGLMPGYIRILYSSGKNSIISYDKMLGRHIEQINIQEDELIGFPEIHAYIAEYIVKHPSSEAKYLGGHPSIPTGNTDCFISTQEDGILVEKVPEYTELFRLPWEKIDSVTADIKSDWNGANLAAGWLLLGPIGSMLMGKRTQEEFGIVARGKDGNGSPVKVPIAFGSVKNMTKIKEFVNSRMMQNAGISI